MKRLAENNAKTDLVFPTWLEAKANGLIQEFAAANNWHYDGIPHAVHHGCRIGKATDLYEGGMDVRDLMERGRWDTEQMAYSSFLSFEETPRVWDTIMLYYNCFTMLIPTVG